MWTGQPTLRAYTICQRCLNYIASTNRRQISHHGTWTSDKVRRTFVEFFRQRHDHLVVPSSSIIPPKDGGTYFTNAGMNQFKPIFLETVDPDRKMAQYRRVTNHQKCIRLGGKHNDLDDVGRDLHHHTFFEMLGSWSFGDYFRNEACGMALELLTEVYGLPINRLYFTYFSGDSRLGLQPDLETKQIWERLGVPTDRILPFDMTDNFWEMGDTGPCGPCTEIHYDHTGDGSGVHLVNKGSPEVVEIWNLVFIEYDRGRDATLTRLLRHHVDTGMGLERMVAVLQNTQSNYNTDLFSPIFDAISKETAVGPYRGLVGKEDEGGIDTAYRIVADHIRMSSIAIADGLLPGRSAGLGLSLRNVMSQCLRQAYQVLEIPRAQDVVTGLVDVVVDSLGESYPELQKNHQKIRNVTSECEKWYTQLLAGSERSFNKYLRKSARTRDQQHVSVEDMVNIHKGKYGIRVPAHIIEDMATRRRLSLDTPGFQEAIQQEQHMEDPERLDELQLDKTMVESLSKRGIVCTDDSYKYSYTARQGQYEFLEGFSGTVVGLVDSEGFVEKVGVGRQCGILMDRTMFYSQAGGQQADIGSIQTPVGCVRVDDVQSFDGYVLHTGYVEEGSLRTGDTGVQNIDQDHRLGCMRNHTATHLLLAAIHKVLGRDVEQAGSSIYPDRFFFDFTSMGSIGPDEVSQIEELVQKSIYRKEAVERRLYPRDVAMAMEGIIPLRDEVYPGEVFVLSIGNTPTCDDRLVSRELCGGTHVTNTGDIGEFYITSATRLGQATKRIYAVTGPYTHQVVETGERVQALCEKVKVGLAKKYKLIEIQELIMQMKRAMEDAMPKMVREKMLVESKRLERLVTMAHNETTHDMAQQVIAEEVEFQKDNNYVIFRLDMKKRNKAIKLLLQHENVGKPLCLVSAMPTTTLVILSGPKKCSDDLKTVAESLNTLYRGSDVLDHSKGDAGCFSVHLFRKHRGDEEVEAVSKLTRTLMDKAYKIDHSHVN